MLGRHFIWLKEDLEAVRENIADDGLCKIRGIRKFIELLQSLINLMVSRPILAVYCMRLLHTIACPFSKYFQILLFLSKFVKYLPLFLKNHGPFPFLGVFIRA